MQRGGQQREHTQDLSERIETIEERMVETQRELEAKLAEHQKDMVGRLNSIVELLTNDHLDELPGQRTEGKRLNSSGGL